MNVPKSSGEKTAPDNNKISLLKEIDYFSLLKRTISLVRNNLRYLLITGALVSLTGGQLLTMDSSLFQTTGGGSGYDTSSNNNSKNSSPALQNQNYPEILKNIQNEENIKRQVNNFLSNKDKLPSLLWTIGIALFLILIMVFLVFLYNCHLNVLFLGQISCLEKGRTDNKKIIKRKIRGKWKKVAVLRLIFVALKIASILLFISPALFFVFQKNWGTAIFLGIIALIALLIALIFLSYVFRYSFLYLLGGNLSLKESIDRGHDLFLKKWKQTVIASLITVASHIVSGIGAFILLFIFLILCALISGLIGLIIVIIIGKIYLYWVIGVLGVLLVLTPVLLFAIILSAVWQSFLTTFWFLFFKEIAGVKITETAVSKILLVKGKKKATEAINKEMTND